MITEIVVTRQHSRSEEECDARRDSDGRHSLDGGRGYFLRGAVLRSGSRIVATGADHSADPRRQRIRFCGPDHTGTASAAARPAGCSELVARTVPDGNTLLVTSSALATNPAIRKGMHRLPSPMLLVVRRSLPVNSVRGVDGTGQSEASPGSLCLTGQGQQSSPVYGAAPRDDRNLYASCDLQGPGAGHPESAGETSIMMMSTVVLLPHVRSGRLRALGVTAATRTPVVPDVPTLAEAGLHGYDAVQWWGLLAPAGIPKGVLALLHKETTAVLGRPDIKGRLAQEGAEVVASSPDEFSGHIRAQVARWAKVVRTASIQPE